VEIIEQQPEASEPNKTVAFPPRGEAPLDQPASTPAEPASPFDLGALVGRGQAFGLIASHALADQAAILKQVHDSRSFESLGLSWNEFCERHAGVSPSYAFKLIQRLNEFGVEYFKLARIVRISTEDYRLLAPAVSDDGIEIDGEVVPLLPENAPRIRQAVRNLREQLRAARKPPVPPNIVQLQMRLDACFREMNVMTGYGPNHESHPALRGLVCYSIDKLKHIGSAIPRPLA
jgi:hypothetical protein